MRAAALAVALAACSIPTKHYDNGSIDAPPGTADSPFAVADGHPDAPPGTPDGANPFACRGQPPPTTAPATITIAGQEYDPLSGMMTANVNVQLMNGGSTLQSTTTDGTGKWSLTVNTGGVPISGPIHFSGGGLTDTWIYPPLPFAKDTMGITVFMVTPSEMSADFMNQPVIFAAVGDCNDMPMAGATVMSTQGQVNYVNDMGQIAPTPPTGMSGLVVIFNAPVGVMVQLSGTASDNGPLRTDVVPTMASTITQTVLTP